MHGSAARRSAAISLLLALSALAVIARSETAAEAEAARLVDGYLRAHNAHRVEDATRFYAPDAVFHLSGDRPAARGLAAIAELERFDAAAGSFVVPQGLAYTSNDRDVRVSLRLVVEHSRVFGALGLDPVITLPEPAAFVVRDGRFIEVTQPALKPACRRAAAAGIAAFIAWLAERHDARFGELTIAGTPHLTAATIPAWIAGLTEWRTATGWSPEAADVADCTKAD